MVDFEANVLTTTPDLSVVVPMYNEDAVLDLLFSKLQAELEKIDVTYEIVCVNDGSSDRTREMLIAANMRDPRIKAINLSRNFGKELALTAGLDHARGAAVIPFDADLQDPPELIAQFVEKWREGYDVVLGMRDARETDTWIKRSSASWFYRVINRVSGVSIPPNAGDFRLMDRRVVDALGSIRERNRFMKGLFAWVGFKQTTIAYARPARAAGTTKFNYWKLWNFALDGITGYSTVPLRMAGYLGVLTAIFAVIYGLYLLIRTLVFGADVPGYASIMVAVVFLGGAQLTVLGIIGEYLGRMYSETKNRPLYVMESVVGLDHATQATEQRVPTASVARQPMAKR